MNPDRMRVLLVEDNADNRYLATLLLEAEGYTVRTARNGAEAVVSARSESYAFALVDIQLPDLDGFEVTRQIRAMRPGLPVVAVSAFAMPADRRRAREAGCCGYVEKPVDADRFVADVRRLANSAAA